MISSWRIVDTYLDLISRNPPNEVIEFYRSILRSIDEQVPFDVQTVGRLVPIIPVYYKSRNEYVVAPASGEIRDIGVYIDKLIYDTVDIFDKNTRIDFENGTVSINNIIVYKTENITRFSGRLGKSPLFFLTIRNNLAKTVAEKLNQLPSLKADFRHDSIIIENERLYFYINISEIKYDEENNKIEVMLTFNIYDVVAGRWASVDYTVPVSERNIVNTLAKYVIKIVENITRNPEIVLELESGRRKFIFGYVNTIRKITDLLDDKIASYRNIELTFPIRIVSPPAFILETPSAGKVTLTINDGIVTDDGVLLNVSFEVGKSQFNFILKGKSTDDVLAKLKRVTDKILELYDAIMYAESNGFRVSNECCELKIHVEAMFTSSFLLVNELLERGVKAEPVWNHDLDSDARFIGVKAGTIHLENATSEHIKWTVDVLKEAIKRVKEQQAVFENLWLTGEIPGLIEPKTDMEAVAFYVALDAYPWNIFTLEKWAGRILEKIKPLVDPYLRRLAGRYDEHIVFDERSRILAILYINKTLEVEVDEVKILGQPLAALAPSIDESKVAKLLRMNLKEWIASLPWYVMILSILS